MISKRKYAPYFAYMYACKYIGFAITYVNSSIRSDIFNIRKGFANRSYREYFEVSLNDVGYVNMLSPYRMFTCFVFADGASLIVLFRKKRDERRVNFI